MLTRNFMFRSSENEYTNELRTVYEMVAFK